MNDEDKELLEDEVVLLYDTHNSTSVRIKVHSVAKRMEITDNKVLRILERHARITPQKCLICNAKMPIHPRCPDCSILLHFGEPHCKPSCLETYKILNANNPLQ